MYEQDEFSQALLRSPISLSFLADLILFYLLRLIALGGRLVPMANKGFLS